jgi:FlaA1/EpsC-like NDP-sugar epimerase
VPICEANPVEAVMNNVGGTIELANACAQRGVEQFVMISTDKAVKPASVMGATKRACELFLKFFAPRTSMKITTVRFGNVLDSSGSVLPIWRQQLREGKKITITDKTGAVVKMRTLNEWSSDVGTTNEIVVREWELDPYFEIKVPIVGEGR